MLVRIFPKQIDNVFRGHWLALWLFGLFLALRLVMSVNSVFNTRAVATGADGMALDSLDPVVATTMLQIFALLAFASVLPVVVGIIALIRYRALVPLLYLLFLFEYLGRRGVAAMNPSESAGPTPIGFYINLGLLGLLVVGFILSLLNGSRGAVSETT